MASGTTLSLSEKLISLNSITPVDGGCQQLMCDFLANLGFQIEPMPFEDVSNFWATYTPAITPDCEHPVFLFAGHTDVVPPGPVEQWQSPPFQPTIRDGFLFGRGAADMKTSLASMLKASEKFILNHKTFKGSIAFLMTSDEEGPFINGTVRVLEQLIKRKQRIDYCVVGEPSSIHQLGDQIRIGRRGSLTGHLTVHGVQGHVAYPEMTTNAIHQALSSLQILSRKHWDSGNTFFPPTSFQICKFNAGSAGNIVPGVARIQFNFRFSSEQNFQSLQNTVVEILNQSAIDYSLDWTFNGMPYLTNKGKLTDAVDAAILSESNLKPVHSTGGGTSDGRFIATTGAEVIELGHCSDSIHKIDEHVRVSDLDRLTRIYFRILENILL